MKTLINKKTGQIIVIKKIMRSEDKIVIDFFDNDILYSKNQVLKTMIIEINKQVLPDKVYNYNDYMNYIAGQTVIDMFKDFERIKEEEIKTTDPVNPIRIYVPFEIIGKEAIKSGIFSNLLTTLSADVKNQKTCETGIISALATIKPEEKQVIEENKDSGIIIEENK